MKRPDFPERPKFDTNPAASFAHSIRNPLTSIKIENIIVHFLS